MKLYYVYNLVGKPIYNILLLWMYDNNIVLLSIMYGEVIGSVGGED